MQVNILEAKNRLSELIRTAQSGEEVIIAKRGEPVARLVPTAAPSPTVHPRGSTAAILERFRNNPMPAHARRTAEEIDADIEAERNAWD